MSSPDLTDRLAYLDATPLMTDVLDQHWHLYDHAMIDREAWIGRMLELKKIRHRIGHCRRPHSDDLGRLEQALRDLDRGAIGAVNAYHDQMHPDPDTDDPLVAAWVRCDHDDASRLVEHARRQYDVQFSLRYSRRPWASAATNERVSSTEGYLWHANFHSVGQHPVNLRRLWNDSYTKLVRESVVYLTSNDAYSLDISFAAVDDPGATADAIGSFFDAVLTNRLFGWEDDDLDASERWIRANQDIDPRVQIGTAWSIDGNGAPVQLTMFSA